MRETSSACRWSSPTASLEAFLRGEDAITLEIRERVHATPVGVTRKR